MSSFEIFIIILISCIATMLTRFLPFILFSKKDKVSKIFLLFEKVMPLMIMIILVFYTLKDVSFDKSPFGLAEIIGILLTIFLHLKYKNVFLSIIASTLIYMFLVQFIF